jgi:hypothetical protein
MVPLCSRVLSVVTVVAALVAVFGVGLVVPRPAAAAGTADLSVDLVASKQVAQAGGEVTITATIVNNGPDAATGVALGFGTGEAVSDPAAACPDGSVGSYCLVGTLAPGERATIKLPVRVCCPGTSGFVVAAASHDAETVDPVSDNDFARLDLRIIGKRRA